MKMEDSLKQLRDMANSYLSQYEPIVLIFATLLALLVARALHSFLSAIQEKGIKALVIGFIMSSVKLIPGVRGYIESEKKKAVEKYRSSNKSNRDDLITALPRIGLGKEVLGKLEEAKSKDEDWKGKCSGTVYIGGNQSEGHFSLTNEAYSMFSHTNPLHQDVFRSIAKFEVEIVAMTAAFLGSKEKESGGQICGNMTSGGTESILLAVKSSRDFMKAKKGVTKPEMIIAESAHSAYDKAAQYFNIKVRRVPVNKEFVADVKAIRRCINRNTILIVGSAPGFPHGVIDPIEGVTSISADVHKYGLGPKGTSIVLYRNHEIRKNQFVAVTEWSGGLYVSPTIAGSRPGGLIAGAWAAMVSLGLNGYLENTRQIMEVSKKIQKGIEEIPELFIIGKPDMTVVAFSSNVIDIFEVNDSVSSKGWHLNALQRPNSLHICVTLQHVPVYEDFLNDLRESVKLVKQNPGPVSGGLAPMYGAAGKIPDRGLVQEVLIEFMDATC
ncbi:hypothetical protein KFK09_008783 [Dendrobium nobile]|uniref:sphinganine-1-phosphate aldolase n=1 Tax=Dendrobium nobile TaxID=94219 RepID=A0A8T3BLN1_DENNO|nr:hypothetical protein KFK09_008783 [Dendrobium nobile]